MGASRRAAQTLLTGAIVCLLLAASPRSRAGVLLDVEHRRKSEPRTGISSHTFSHVKAPDCLIVQVRCRKSSGSLTFRLRAPDSSTVWSCQAGEDFLHQSKVLENVPRRGEYRVEAEAQKACAWWDVRVVEVPAREELCLFFLSGPLIFLVVVVSILLWRRFARRKPLRPGGGSWRWLLAGAGVWTVGVALKIGWALSLNQTVIDALGTVATGTPFLILGGLYIGVLTGVFEIGITLAAALLWPRMAEDEARALGVGVGAGTFEAFILGVTSLGVTAIGLSSLPYADKVLPGLVVTTALSPLPWLLAPVERVLAILCHAASRVLTLRAVVTGRWSLFLWGFGLMSLLDSVAGYVHLADKVGRVNMWWIELAILPFALASLPLLRWGLAAWPERVKPSPESVEPSPESVNESEAGPEKDPSGEMGPDNATSA